MAEITDIIMPGNERAFTVGSGGRFEELSDSKSFYHCITAYSTIHFQLRHSLHEEDEVFVLLCLRADKVMIFRSGACFLKIL